MVGSRSFRLVIIAFALAMLIAPVLQMARGSAFQPSSEPEEQARLYFFRDDQIAVAVRDSSRLETDTSIYLAALMALFDGPADDELGAGLRTMLPGGITVRSSIIVEDGVATVDLSDEFIAGPNESGRAAPPILARRMAQVVFTLTQFEQINRVAFVIEGESIDAVDSDGAAVFRPVSREDYASLTPAILVESPGVWERLTSPMRLMGTASTFEANVQYRITDARGTSVIEGFFSASSGSGMRATFDEEIEFDVTRQGRATLVLFEQSAVDGQEVNIIAIPIEIVRSEEPTPTSPPIVQQPATFTPSAPATATVVAPATSTPSETATAVPTSTAEPTATSEPTVTPEPTATEVSTSTPEPTATATP